MSTMLDDDAVREAIRAMYLDGERPAPSITAHELRMKGSRSRLRVGFKAPIALAAAVLLVVILFTATPLVHKVHPSTSGSHNHIVKSAKTYAAYGLQLTVPGSWSVSFFPGCPTETEPGVLEIGESDIIYNCPIYQGRGTRVTLYSGSAPKAWTDGLPKSISVNGIHVLNDTSGGISLWYVPSAHAYVYARGPGSKSVLATLHRSTSRAVPAPGIGKGSAYLVALARVPKSGPVQIRSVATGKTTPVQAVNGQFSFQGLPGRYVVTTDAGSAPCAPIHVSLTSGTYSTWPPLVCQGE